MARRKSDGRQESLISHGEELGDETPLIYIAVPLSQVQEDHRETIELLAHTVTETIVGQTDSEKDPWVVRVHSPIKHSAPWKKDGRTPEEIYELNTSKIWLEADAVVVIADHGGSLGIGQELAWACSLQLPIVILHREGTTISRQPSGAAAEYDIELLEYSDPEHMRDLLGRWLISHRAQICDGPRRRVGRRAHLTGICTLLAARWEQLSPEERHHAVMVARMPAIRVERIVSDPLVMAAASVQELIAIGCAVGIDLLDLPRTPPPPELAPSQREALAAAATELGWSHEETLRLHNAARVEMGRGGVRRLPLASINDWLEFRGRDER
jgi:hypothetical protein